MIRTSGLVKRYGDVTALDGLDLVVPRGTVLGLLGPNGAGKTTAVRILTTLIDPDGGSAEVAGIDVAAHPDKVRERIGLSGQNAAVDEHLTGYENLDMVGRLYHLGKEKSRARARELQDLFLDEPTSGLDPRSRIQMWETIQELVRGGSTVLLTTQYMEEADRLADDIVVIDRGRKIAHGTSDQLKAQIGGERVETVLASSADLPPAQTILAHFCAGDEIQVDEQTRKLTVAVTGGVEVLRQILQRLSDANIAVADIGLRRPTLDDVFLSLTGHVAEEVAENGEGSEGDRKDTREKEAVR